MPRMKKPNVPTETQNAEPKIPKELLDQLITGPITQGEFESIYRALKKAIIERAMSAEMTEHLGYKHGEPKPGGQTGNPPILSCSQKWKGTKQASPTSGSV